MELDCLHGYSIPSEGMKPDVVNLKSLWSSLGAFLRHRFGVNFILNLSSDNAIRSFHLANSYLPPFNDFPTLINKAEIPINTATSPALLISTLVKPRLLTSTNG
jgi:hypothetical protein